MFIIDTGTWDTLMTHLHKIQIKFVLLFGDVGGGFQPATFSPSFIRSDVDLLEKVIRVELLSFLCCPSLVSPLSNKGPFFSTPNRCFLENCTKVSGLPITIPSPVHPTAPRYPTELFSGRKIMVHFNTAATCCSER